MSSKLIIIRGNSGSGKTTIAQQVRSKLSDGLSDNTLLLQQDVLRRDMLRERDMLDKHSIIELIKLVVAYGRSQGRIVILEGILSSEKYGTMLTELAGTFDQVHVYYFDVPFQETLLRHASKPNAHEFGEKEMREWWKEKDYLGLPGEKILSQDLGIDDIVHKIISDLSAVDRLS